MSSHNLSRVSRGNWPDEVSATYRRQGAKSNSKETDESNPVIRHDDSRCAFLIERITRSCWIVARKEYKFRGVFAGTE